MAIAVCGEIERPEAIPVWIGDASVAQDVMDRLRTRAPNSWVDAYGTITHTPFAVLGADGTVSRFTLTISSEDGQMITGDGHAWMGDGSIVSLITGVRTGEPTFVDPPRPFAFDGMTCPNHVTREDWESKIESRPPGDRDGVEPYFEEMVICAYLPYQRRCIGPGSGAGRDPARLGGGEARRRRHRGCAGQRATRSVCTQEAGYAYVILLGADGELSTVLYAEAFGCDVVSDVTPGPRPSPNGCACMWSPAVGGDPARRGPTRDRRPQPGPIEGDGVSWPCWIALCVSE